MHGSRLDQPGFEDLCLLLPAGGRHLHGLRDRRFRYLLLQSGFGDHDGRQSARDPGGLQEVLLLCRGYGHHADRVPDDQ